MREAKRSAIPGAGYTQAPIFFSPFPTLKLGCGLYAGAGYTWVYAVCKMQGIHFSTVFVNVVTKNMTFKKLIVQNCFEKTEYSALRRIPTRKTKSMHAWNKYFYRVPLTRKKVDPLVKQVD